MTTIRRIALGMMILTTAILTGGASAGEALQITSATTEFKPGFLGELEKVAASHRGDMAIYCHHLEKDEYLAVNADTAFPTASTIKLAVMCAAMDMLAQGTGPYKGYFDTKIYDETSSASGSGWIRNFKPGTKLELKELIHFMITVSDNTGTNMITEWIGIDKINQWLIDRGFIETRMFSTVGGSRIYDPAGRKEWGLGRTTAKEMGKLMEMIANGKAGTTSTTDEMQRILGHQYFDGGIASGLPPMIYVGSKSGALNDLRADVAIVKSPSGTYILSIYTNNNEDTRWTNENEADIAIRKISTMIWDHYNPDAQWQRPAGADAF